MKGEDFAAKPLHMQQNTQRKLKGLAARAAVPEGVSGQSDG